MCSDSEQPFEGNEPRLIFSSYHFRNQKKQVLVCTASCDLTARAEILFSCSLFSRLGLLLSCVNPHACASLPRLQSRGPCSAPDTVSVNSKWWRKTEKQENPPALLWASVKISSICYIFCFPCGGTNAGSEITLLTATLVCTAIKQVNV